MDSNYDNPINIGSDEMVLLNELANMVMEIAGKNKQLIILMGP